MFRSSRGKSWFFFLWGHMQYFLYIIFSSLFCVWVAACSLSSIWRRTSMEELIRVFPRRLCIDASAKKPSLSGIALKSSSWHIYISFTANLDHFLAAAEAAAAAAAALFSLLLLCCCIISSNSASVSFPSCQKGIKNGFRIAKHRVIWSDARFCAHVIFVHSGEDRIDLEAKIIYFLQRKSDFSPIFCRLLTCAFVRFFDIFSISCFVMYPSLFLSMAWKARSALAEVLVSAGGEEEGGPGSFSPCSQAKMQL